MISLNSLSNSEYKKTVLADGLLEQ